MYRSEKSPLLRQRGDTFDSEDSVGLPLWHSKRFFTKKESANDTEDDPPNYFRSLTENPFIKAEMKRSNRRRKKKVKSPTSSVGGEKLRTESVTADELKIGEQNLSDGTDKAHDHHHDHHHKNKALLLKEIKVVNPENVDHITLLKELHDSFAKSIKKWRLYAGLFGCANLFVTLTVVALQLVQIICFQISFIPLPTKVALATILPAVTSTVLALQLKFGWDKKVAACKRAVNVYHQLINQTEHKSTVGESGGKVKKVDVVKVWNRALMLESSEIPVNMTAY